MRIYLSSKMTGKKDYGESMFQKMEDYVKEKYNNPSVFNPYIYAKYFAENKGISIEDISRETILKHDIRYLLESDLVLVGEEDSKGVEFELYLAKQLGIKIEYFQ